MTDAELMSLIDNSLDTRITPADIGLDLRRTIDLLQQALAMADALAVGVEMVDDPRMANTRADVLVAQRRVVQALEALEESARSLPAKSPRTE